MTATTRRGQIDVERVRQAVEAAERLTSAEIVVSLAPWFIGSVWAAAKRTFSRLGIAATRGRNGVLIFVVPARRQLVVLGDDAIGEVIDPVTWRSVTAQITAAFARGDGTTGIVDGVELLTRLLGSRFPRRADDVNELPDQPRG